MTVSKLRIIQKNIEDAYNNISVLKNFEAFKRKIELLNLITTIKLFLKEACIKEEYTLLEIDGINTQLKLISDIRNSGTEMTSDYINLEKILLKRKEDLELTTHNWETTTIANLPEELLTQITSWYN